MLNNHSHAPRTVPAPPRAHRRGWLAAAALALGTLACSLASEPPPTLRPRDTATPPPTIGYATLAPNAVPPGAVTVPASSVNRREVGLTPLMNQIQTDRLMQHVRALVGFGTRHVNSVYRPGWGVAAAASYLYDEMAALRSLNPNIYVATHDFQAEWNGVRSVQRNIVTIIPGIEPGGGTIVVGAHYDSRITNLNDGTSLAPGADDNASGSAALVEMVRALAPYSHRSTIIVVHFAAEEVGRQGSKAFVRDYVLAQNIQPWVMINVDTIGGSRDALGRTDDRQMRLYSSGPNDSSPSRRMARQINLINFNFVDFMNLDVVDSIDREGRYGDHFSFEEVGIPAVRFIEMMENTAMAEENDRIERIDPNYLTRATQSLTAVVHSFAAGPRPPVNVALREHGDGTRTLVWDAVPGATSYVVALRKPGSLIYNQQFEVSDASVRWDGFRASDYVNVAVSAKDASGLMGPLSREVVLP